MKFYGCDLRQGFFFFLTFIYLAVRGLSCGMWDLHCVKPGLLLRHSNSLVAARGILVP